jgi:hypothetical protein
MLLLSSIIVDTTILVKNLDTLHIFSVEYDFPHNSHISNHIQNVWTKKQTLTLSQYLFIVLLFVKQMLIAMYY